MSRRATTLAALAAVSLAVAGCPQPLPLLTIDAPFDEEIVVTNPVPVAITFRAGAVPATFTATLNGVDVTASFAVTPGGATAAFTVGVDPAIATGRNLLKATVDGPSGTVAAVSDFSVALGNAIAQQVTAGSAALLVDGPSAIGRVGDWAMYNDLIQVVIDDVSPTDGGGKTVRDTFGVHVFGGNIVDADLKRAPGDPERDNFGALTPLINVEATPNYRTATLVNDGTNGQPAVLRFEGPDDLLDTQNLSSLIVFLGGGLFGLPPQFDDADLDIDLVTEYSLAPGDNFVTITTTVRNNSAAAIAIPVGDWVNNSGEGEIFIPGLGYGGMSGSGTMLRLETDYIAMVPRGPSMAGVSYGYIPDLQGNNNSASDSGLNIFLRDASIFDLIFGATPGFSIPPGGTNSYTRYFVVGNGDTTAVSAVRDAQTGVATGKVEGFVTSAGQPVAGARVSVVTLIPGIFQSAEVLGGFETDANGHYVGTAPTGLHKLIVNASGHPANVSRNVVIDGGATAYEDFDLAQAGALEVTIVDEGGQPIAGKVSVVGIDTSPSDNVKLDILGFVTAEGGIFRTVSDRLRRGLSAVHFAPPAGVVAPFALEPGDYQVVVSHGPEYDVHRENVTVTAGATTTVNATVRRVLDTAGFVGSDFHQHATASFDAPASDRTRVTTNLAEGLDFFISTDHDFVADQSAELAAVGGTGKVAYALSLEVTPSDYGHINPWPIVQIPGSRNFGAYDWGRGEVPGQDFPSFGSFARSPGEIYAALRLLDPDPGPEVVQMNHVNSELQGTLDGLGIDTGVVPPQSLQSPTKFRLDPGLANLFDPNFDAMELWIGSGNSNISLLTDQSWGDWMNLLNQGLVRTATANSDTHIAAMTQVGAPRTYVASSTDDPASIDPDEIAQSVLDGKAICSNGPFVTVEASAASTGETAGLGIGQARLASTTDGTVDLTIQIQAAPWVAFDRVELYVNTVPVGVDTDGDPTTPPVYGVAPQQTLVAGTDFAINNVAVNGSTRQEAAIATQLTGLGATDRWVVVAVRGTQGTSPSLFPVIPNDIDTNQTFAELIVNTPGEPGVRALAFTNPLFIDANNNDVYDSPL